MIEFKNIIGFKNNKKIIGKGSSTNDLYLVSEKGKIYYYNGYSEKFINSNINCLKKCLNSFLDTDKKIKYYKNSLNEPVSILKILKLYQEFLHHITIIDFKGAKSYFWQETMYDTDIIIDENIEKLIPYEQEYLDIFIKKHIALTIAEIKTIEDYMKINPNELKSNINRKFKTIIKSEIQIKNFITKSIITNLYGKETFDEYLKIKEERIREIFGKNKNYC